MDKKNIKELKRQNIPPEPEESNQNCALIALRFPHDGNVLKRRFLKTEKIQVLKFLYNILIKIIRL